MSPGQAAGGGFGSQQTRWFSLGPNSFFCFRISTCVKTGNKVVRRSVPHTLPGRQALPVASVPHAPRCPKGDLKHSPGPTQALRSWAAFSLWHLHTRVPTCPCTHTYARACTRSRAGLDGVVHTHGHWSILTRASVPSQPGASPTPHPRHTQPRAPQPVSGAPGTHRAQRVLFHINPPALGVTV